MTAVLDDTGQVEPLPTVPGSIDFSTKRILCLGDSITWGTNVVTPSCGYRDSLANLLAAAGFVGMQWVGSVVGGDACIVCPNNGQQMFNEGHSGFTCNDLVVITPAIYAAQAVDVTLNMIGTNDMVAVVEMTETLAAAIANWNNFFTTMIAQAPRTIFFVANLVPSPALSVPTPTFNANIATQVAAAAAAGTDVQLVDMFSALNPATDFDVGGVHPNNLGYGKMAATWFAAMT
jgi:lysophospholipase L1-like esterase